MPTELIHFLKYVENSTEECAQTSQNPAIMDLHGKITTLKQSRELEEKYMMMEELLKDREAEGKAEGKAESIELVTCMIKDARIMDIPRLQNDREFYQEMLKTYHL